MGVYPRREGVSNHFSVDTCVSSRMTVLSSGVWDIHAVYYMVLAGVVLWASWP